MGRTIGIIAFFQENVTPRIDEQREGPSKLSDEQPMIEKDLHMAKLVCNGGKIASGDRSWANEVAPYEDAETENASEDIVAQLLGGLSVTEAWAKRIG
ncbi:uncharacterized protein RCO7_11397 [Rhynchosporium graminicola]|uniref:Uncharacterized protein n=1 Tax=Rhynchosporium graminicola TaxID=2792576 RepID=A0A1E1LQ08_9HELO|nr:uncharacterized protein RCO7_11397 [Rhynchosporium commune]